MPSRESMTGFGKVPSGAGPALRRRTPFLETMSTRSVTRRGAEL
jgi:hypothetical protein